MQAQALGCCDLSIWPLSGLPRRLKVALIEANSVREIERQTLIEIVRYKREAWLLSCPVLCRSIAILPNEYGANSIRFNPLPSLCKSSIHNHCKPAFRLKGCETSFLADSLSPTATTLHAATDSRTRGIEKRSQQTRPLSIDCETDLRQVSSRLLLGFAVCLAISGCNDTIYRLGSLWLRVGQSS